MTAYIVDTEKFEIYSSRANSDDINMSEDFGPDAGIKYILCRDEDELYDYWHLHHEESGKFYEGRGYSEDRKHDMFKGWLDNELYPLTNKTTEDLK